MSGKTRRRVWILVVPACASMYPHSLPYCLLPCTSKMPGTDSRRSSVQSYPLGASGMLVPPALVSQKCRNALLALVPVDPHREPPSDNGYCCWQYALLGCGRPELGRKGQSRTRHGMEPAEPPSPYTIPCVRSCSPTCRFSSLHWQNSSET